MTCRRGAPPARVPCGAPGGADLDGAGPALRTLPITGTLDSFTASPLALGLLGLAGVITWQVRAVLRSQYPGLRAIEALAAAFPLFLLLFAAAYVMLADAQAQAFSEPLSRTDAL